jgi:hypothetical protein
VSAAAEGRVVDRRSVELDRAEDVLRRAVASHVMSGWSPARWRVVVGVRAVVGEELRLQRGVIHAGRCALVGSPSASRQRRIRRRVRRLLAVLADEGVRRRSGVEHGAQLQLRPTPRCGCASLVGLPGIWTTIWLPPAVVTSASPTPEASTRWRMIVTAWSICSVVGATPSSVCASRMICVPPCEVEGERGRP